MRFQFDTIVKMNEGSEGQGPRIIYILKQYGTIGVKVVDKESYTFLVHLVEEAEGKHRQYIKN